MYNSPKHTQSLPSFNQVAFTLLAAFMLFALITTPAAATKIQTELPLKSINGTVTSFEQQAFAQNDKKRWLLVYFWAHNCGICAVETPTLSDFHTANKDDLVSILGISIDGYDNIPLAQDFINKYKPKFPSYVANLSEVAKYFAKVAKEPFRGTPTFLLFDPKGQLIAVQPGPVKPSAIKSFIESLAKS